MKSKLALIIAATALSLFQQNMALAIGEFSKSCSNITLVGISGLIADCKTEAGDVHGSFQYLEEVIGNSDGTLTWMDNDNYPRIGSISGGRRKKSEGSKVHAGS